MAVRDSKTFWGGALAVASGLATMVPGLVAGTVNAVSGTGSFQDGVDSVMDPAINAASQFGDDHADKLNTVGGWVAGGVVSALAGMATKDVANRVHPQPPQNTSK